MAKDQCNVNDKRELDYLRALKAQGIDGERMLKDVGGYNAETGAFRVGNIRLDKFTIPDEAKGIMEKLVKEAQYFIEQRRGTMSFEKTHELGMELKARINLKAGTALNAEELDNLAEVVGGLSIRAHEAAQLAEQDNTELNIAIATAAREELNLALASLSGAVSEAGRALSILRRLKAGINTRDAKLIREAIRASEGRYSGEQIAALVAKLPQDDVMAQYRFLQGMRQPHAGDYIMELWYNSILSGPLTQVRNVVGNTSNGLFIMASHPAGVLYDAFRSARTGTPRQMYFNELLRLTKGIDDKTHITGSLPAAFLGMRQGFGKAMFAMRNGFTFDEASMLELRKPEAIKGGIGRLINTPRRLLIAADLISRSFFMQYELSGRVFAAAKAEGLTGAALETRIAELMANPTPEILKGSKEFAAESVFQQEGGRFLSAMSKIRQSVDVGEITRIKALKGLQPISFIVPFVETPANIYRAGFRATPLGFIGRSADERQAAQQFGRALLGSIFMMGLAFYAASGNITGSGPADKDKKDALYRIGWQPNSIKIGGKWYSYLNILPLNIPLSLIGNMVDMQIYDDVAPDTQGLATLFTREAKSLFSASFLSGVNGLMSALAGDEKEQQKFVNRFGLSVIPQFVQQTTRFLDPTLYNITDFGDQFKNALGFHNGMPAKYDALGKKIERQRAGGLPFFPSPAVVSPVEQKLINLGVQFLSPPPSRIGKRAMSDKEYSDFTQKVGERTARALADDSILPPDLGARAAQDKVDEVRAKIYKDVRSEMFPDLKGQDSVLRYEDDTAQSPNGIIDNVILYAKSIGTDPVTAFNRIFTGQRLLRVDHNTIIVYRMELAKSEALKKKLGATDEQILDHTVPLEIGGGNNRQNLKLVPKSVWQSYTPAENHLGRLLKDGKITKVKAQRLIRDFKDGKIDINEITDLR